VGGVEQLTAQENADPGPDGQFLTLTSPIEADDYALVTRWALKLQDQAQRERRKMFLVLQIPDGPSQFHQVYGLAEFLTGNSIPDVTVIAWLPESVSGHNVLVALAANEIVMAPDAQIGDMGRGKAVDEDKRQQVHKLVERGRNPLVSKPIAEALMNPAVDLQQAKIERGEGNEKTTELRFLTSAEIRREQNDGILIPEVNEIKPAGAVGSFSGRRLKQLGMLITHTDASRAGVAARYGLPSEALKEPGADERETKARLVKLEGPIDWQTEFRLTRQIDRAVEQGATILVIEIDSPGGMLGPSHNLSEKFISLSDKNVRTIAYVPREAISGGGLIALGCDEIYLHPDAHIGDIGPIEMREGGQFQHAPEKVVSMLREIVRTLAEKKGRPPALLMSMCDLNLPVYRVTDRETGRVWYASQNEIDQPDNQWIKGELVDGTQEGTFLTLDGKRASELMIAEPPVDSFDDFKLRVGIPLDDNVLAMQVQWSDTLISILNTRAAMFFLFLGGLACLYLELNLPSGLFGVLSALCFTLFFWSRFLSGAAGWLEVMLFLVGIVCIVIEIFVLPGLGVVGISGAILIIVSMVMASQTYSGLDSGNAANVMRTVGTLFGAGFSVIIFAVVMSHMLPKIPFFRSMILAPEGAEELHDPEAPRLKPELHSPSPLAGLVGEHGQAVTLLKPYGKAVLADQVMDVVSQGTMIDSGATVEVVEVSGNKIVVREVT
jgi:membrane-bound serine protease (ClpP class)